jgi:DNA-binding FadR family transcriptional regulator
MSESITYEELLAELERLGTETESEAGLTVREWSARWGINVRIVRERIAEAQAHGMVRVGRKKGTTISGASRTIPAYSFIQPPPEEKKNRRARNK